MTLQLYPVCGRDGVMVADVNGSDALIRAGTEFANRLDFVGASDWVRATPCDAWDVRDLVNHVVGGNLRYAMILRGDESSDILATHDVDWLGADPHISFESSFQQVTEAFDVPGKLRETVFHPKSGTMPGAHLRVLRVNELTVHAWDLARALGVDEYLDEGLVDWLADRMTPIGEMISQSGMYAPSVSIARVDESPQIRYLHLLGRHP